jgi:CheY-like chemotaxis protein
MMTFSRRKNSADLSDVQLTSVVKENTALLSASLPKTISFDVVCEAVNSVISGNASQIGQALMNLCVNARDAMREDKGNITIRVFEPDLSQYADYLKFSALLPTPMAQPVVALFDGFPGQSFFALGSFALDRSYVALSVTDTGSGISRTTMEKMFEPFFTTKPVNKGTGLGLAMVHGMIVSHRGAMLVESVLARGTSFTLFFPLGENVAAGMSGQSKAEVGHAATTSPDVNAHVMLVEDQAEVQAMMHQLLLRMGLSVSVFENGLDALDALREDFNQFHIVITDHNMPRMTGTQLAFEASLDFPDLPFVLYSGYSDQELEDIRAERPNIRAVLRKPISADHVRSTIVHVLAEARQRKAA